jgi:CubicO group peptidase (beta-lactamase class C family)
MLRILPFLVLVLVAGLSTPPAPVGAAEAVPLTTAAAIGDRESGLAGDPAGERAFAPVVERIRSWVDGGHYRGASIIVVQRGRTLLLRRFGDHHPASVEFIASAGKWLAAAAIMALVDAGRLRLDDTAGRWLPELRGDLGRATLRQLLAHTSGYPPYQPDGAHRDDYQTLTESVAHIAPLASLTPPGTRWNYGGLGMQVAGRMAEVATGETWEALFQRTIATPLGMGDTSFTPVDQGRGHSPMLGGGARSSLRDYARFLAMLADRGLSDGRRVLSPQAVAELQADQIGLAELPAEHFIATVRGATHRGIYGLGAWRELVGGDGTALLVSSPSWAGTYPWLDHRLQLHGFFLAHVADGGAGRGRFDPMRASAELPALIATAVTALAGGSADAR